MVTNASTRRTFLITIGTVVALTNRVGASISYTIEHIFEVEGVVRPDMFTYDMFQWEDSGVLRFEDGDVARFGTANPPVTEEPAAIDGAIDLPMEVDFQDMEIGTATFLIGVMGILLAAAAVLRNYAAGIVWSISFIVLILAGLFGFGLELFWVSIIATMLLLVVGLVVRWSQ